MDTRLHRLHEVKGHLAAEGSNRLIGSVLRRASGDNPARTFGRAWGLVGRDCADMTRHVEAHCLRGDAPRHGAE